MTKTLKDAIKEYGWHKKSIDMPMRVNNFHKECMRKTELLISNYKTENILF